MISLRGLGLFVFLVLTSQIWALSIAKAADGTISNGALSPSSVLSQVYSKNPDLASQEARADAEDSLISSKYTPANPRIGFMRESGMNLMQQQMGPMNSWVVSQELMFPTKYFSMGSMQRYRAKAAHEEFLDTKLKVRQNALTRYYGYYSASRILSLLEAQKETLREIARIAESRRATGAVPQQDEMKAHVEQTKIENEIILQKQELVEAQAELNALLNQDQGSELPLPKEDLPVPKIAFPQESIESLAAESSKMISAQKFMLEETESAKSLATMSYFPDFMLSYRKPFGQNSPSNAYAVGIEMTIPLWFFSKQTSEVASASARVLEAEHKLTQTRRMTEAETKRLVSKAETLSKLLKIYETALIPQSTSALNSSRAAYSAGRVGFQELLDAERSLYSVRIEYYRNLANFVETLTGLERVVGTSVSDLPMDARHTGGGA